MSDPENFHLAPATSAASARTFLVICARVEFRDAINARRTHPKRVPDNGWGGLLTDTPCRD